MRELNEALRIGRHYLPSTAHNLAGLIGWGSIMVIPFLVCVALNDGAQNSVRVEAPRFVEAGR